MWSVISRAPAVSLNWSAGAADDGVTSSACAAHDVAMSQARTRIECAAGRSMGLSLGSALADFRSSRRKRSADGAAAKSGLKAMHLIAGAWRRGSHHPVQAGRAEIYS